MNTISPAPAKPAWTPSLTPVGARQPRSLKDGHPRLLRALAGPSCTPPLRRPPGLRRRAHSSADHTDGAR